MGLSIQNFIQSLLVTNNNPNNNPQIKLKGSNNSPKLSVTSIPKIKVEIGKRIYKGTKSNLNTDWRPYVNLVNGSLGPKDIASDTKAFI